MKLPLPAKDVLANSTAPPAARFMVDFLTVATVLEGALCVSGANCIERLAHDLYSGPSVTGLHPA